MTFDDQVDLTIAKAQAFYPTFDWGYGIELANRFYVAAYIPGTTLELRIACINEGEGLTRYLSYLSVGGLTSIFATEGRTLDQVVQELQSFLNHLVNQLRTY